MDRRTGTIGIGVAVLALLAAGCGADDDTATPGPSAAAPATTAVAAHPFTCPAGALDAGSPATGPAAAGRRLRVVTTVAPITSIVANVAGDAAEVTGLIPEGEDSHTYEPKPSVAAVLSRADVVFVNGLQLEDPTKELAEANRAPGSEIVQLGTLTITPDEYLYDFSFPRAGGKPNPHLWTNPPMAACYARIAANVLAQADPAHAATYRANAAAYEAKVDALDQLMVQATASVPPDGRKLLTYHDAYAYFAERYGWQVIGAIQVSSFEDPTPKEVVRLIDQVKATHVPAIFGSEVFPSPVLQAIAEDTGVRYVDTLRDDDLPGAPGDPDHSYLGLMRFDFVTMVSNLGGDASGLRAFDASDVTPDHAEYPQ
jgi:ABC-type Zn uptake system ZnuABC Zn-binding protein ZnuA